MLLIISGTCFQSFHVFHDNKVIGHCSFKSVLSDKRLRQASNMFISIMEIDGD